MKLPIVFLIVFISILIGCIVTNDFSKVQQTKENIVETNSSIDEFPNPCHNQEYSFSIELLHAINKEREKVGVAPLIHDENIAYVAKVKAWDMGESHYFSHTSPTHGTIQNMLQTFQVPFTEAYEVINRSELQPKQIIAAWMRDKRKRAYILNENYTHSGIGYYKDGSYVVQILIK